MLKEMPARSMRSISACRIICTPQPSSTQQRRGSTSLRKADVHEASLRRIQIAAAVTKAGVTYMVRDTTSYSCRGAGGSSGMIRRREIARCSAAKSGLLPAPAARGANHSKTPGRASLRTQAAGADRHRDITRPIVALSRGAPAVSIQAQRVVLSEDRGRKPASAQVDLPLASSARSSRAGRFPSARNAPHPHHGRKRRDLRLQRHDLFHLPRGQRTVEARFEPPHTCR